MFTLYTMSAYYVYLIIYYMLYEFAEKNCLSKVSKGHGDFFLN